MTNDHSQQFDDADLRSAMFRGRIEYERAQLDGLGDAHWWLHRRMLDDGGVLYLIPLGWGMLQLAWAGFNTWGDRPLTDPSGGPPYFYDESWYYTDHEAAWHAVLEWEPPFYVFTPGPDEPSGWYRHPATGRRRHDGTEATEYYQR